MAVKLRAVYGEKRKILLVGNKTFPCVFGKAGVSNNKKEGDNKTPLGTMQLGTLYYRKDRFHPPPKTAFTPHAISKAHGWSDDISDPHYNEPVQLPHPFSHEPLWRNDHIYDALLTLTHNTTPKVSGNGSAIFLHLAQPDFSPTKGCLAVSQETMDYILKTTNPKTTLTIEEE
ncbi:MAG: L,D-transpeptidase family protein [Parvibaculales bacterium]